MGDRKTWRELLPIIQAFVNGETVQRLDYDGRWKDVDAMYSVLARQPWRIRPKGAKPKVGRWTRCYRDKCLGSSPECFEEGYILFDNMTDDDVPSWPQRNYVESPRFTPK